MKALLALFLLFDSALADGTPREYGLAKLRKAKISEGLIAEIEKAHKEDERNKIVERNVLGFMGKADYSVLLTEEAVYKCRDLLVYYAPAFEQAEAEHGVPRQVIAALLWVETRHGAIKGTHHVGHVYFSLLQADHPEVLARTLEAHAARAPASSDMKRERRLIQRRAKARAQWAMGELKSLDKMYRRNPERVGPMTGSFAGAFGIAQFIPSSYLIWSRPKGDADLFRMEHAIQSVGYFLKVNGWKKNKPRTHRRAILRYNRDKDYADTILKLAAQTVSK